MKAILLCLTLLFVASCDDPDDTNNNTTNNTNVNNSTGNSTGTSGIVIPSFTNPIIENGSLFTGSNWNDPHVLYDGTQLIMYASADTNFSGNIQIYRLVSSDAVHWELSPSTSVFSHNTDPQAWDFKSTETPSVVFFRGEYHLFYTGYPADLADPYSYRIGHATSPDGITWTRDSSPLLAPTDPGGEVNMDFNQHVVAEPGAVVVDDQILLYFTAMGASAAVGTILQTIGLSTFDGTSWSTPVMVLEPDQSLYPRDTYIGFSTPAAVYYKGQVHLFVDVVVDDPWQQVAIHHSVSDDGRSGWTQDSTPLLYYNDFTWTSKELRAPSAIYVDSRLLLFVAGHDDANNLGIGLFVYEEGE